MIESDYLPINKWIILPISRYINVLFTKHINNVFGPSMNGFANNYFEKKKGQKSFDFKIWGRIDHITKALKRVLKLGSFTYNGVGIGYYLMWAV